MITLWQKKIVYNFYTSHPIELVGIIENRISGDETGIPLSLTLYKLAAWEYADQ